MKWWRNLKTTRIVAGIIVIIFLVFLILPKGENIPIGQKPNPSPTSTEKFTTHNIELTGQGFVPESITIKKGDIVVWTNKSGKEASVNSTEFPTHQLYPELNLGTFENNSTLQAKIETLGELEYINFFNSLQRGTILVEE